MNYEKAYKDALERAKKQHSRTIIANLPGDREKIEEIFPELRESEDEKIRKEMIGFMSSQLKSLMPPCPSNEKLKTWISWLEKQGEKKDTVIPQWMIDFLKEHRRNFATPMDYDEKKETDGKLISVIKWLEGNPQLEQKPSWSEKDTKILDEIIDELTPCGECPDYPSPEEQEYYYTRTSMIDWLKSLKPQTHWKPSEEQMEALKYFISFHEDHARSLTTKWEEFKNLESLYNDLKSL